MQNKCNRAVATATFFVYTRHMWTITTFSRLFLSLLLWHVWWEPRSLWPHNVRGPMMFYAPNAKFPQYFFRSLCSRFVLNKIINIPVLQYGKCVLKKVNTFNTPKVISWIPTVQWISHQRGSSIQSWPIKTSYWADKDLF